jgi:hypothetical protein
MMRERKNKRTIGVVNMQAQQGVNLPSDFPLQGGIDDSWRKKGAE